MLPLAEIAGIAVGASAVAAGSVLATTVAGLATPYRRFINLAVPGCREQNQLQGGEQARFASADGVLLEGRLFISEEKSCRTVIFCHEAGSTMNALLQYGWFLRSYGFNLLTFSFRTEAKGPIRRARPWVNDDDVNDLLGAVRYAKSVLRLQKGELGLLGVSRGGSAALCVAAREHTIGAVVTDGSFDTRSLLETYIRKRPRCWHVKLVPGLMSACRSRALLLAAAWRLGYRFQSVTAALRRARHTSLLLIHGEKDGYIPSSLALDLFRHASHHRVRELWLVPGAGHNSAVFCHRAEYERRVAAFFNAHLFDAPIEGDAR
jgi:uncharacterized protein